MHWMVVLLLVSDSCSFLDYGYSSFHFIAGVEGNIYEHYPNFPNRVNEALRDLYGHKVDRINLGVSK